MNVLVTGADGLMGKALRPFLPYAFYKNRKQLDVTDPYSVWDAMHLHRPNVVIHLAAVTDHQTRDIPKLIETNIVGTQIIAEYTKEIGAKLVYLSTHYIYPGKYGLYAETHTPEPIGSYAWTKYAGELAVKSSGVPYLIIRGSWYGAEKLELWKKNGALADAHSNRERVESAAEKIAKLVELDAQGTYNIGGKRRTFWKILTDEGYDGTPIRRDELGGLGYDFPRDSSVSTDKYDALVA